MRKQEKQKVQKCRKLILLENLIRLSKEIRKCEGRLFLLKYRRSVLGREGREERDMFVWGGSVCVVWECVCRVEY